jgi:hypothetical protein
MLTMVNVDKLWDELRGDQHFRELVERMGFD